MTRSTVPIHTVEEEQTLRTVSVFVVWKIGATD